MSLRPVGRLMNCAARSAGLDQGVGTGLLMLRGSQNTTSAHERVVGPRSVHRAQCSSFGTEVFNHRPLQRRCHGLGRIVHRRQRATSSPANVFHASKSACARAPACRSCRGESLASKSFSRALEMTRVSTHEVPFLEPRVNVDLGAQTQFPLYGRQCTLKPTTKTTGRICKAQERQCSCAHREKYKFRNVRPATEVV